LEKDSAGRMSDKHGLNLNSNEKKFFYYQPSLNDRLDSRSVPFQNNPHDTCAVVTLSPVLYQVINDNRTEPYDR
jgi:hypothetical protein